MSDMTFPSQFFPHNALDYRDGVRRVTRMSILTIYVLLTKFAKVFDGPFVLAGGMHITGKYAQFSCFHQTSHRNGLRVQIP